MASSVNIRVPEDLKTELDAYEVNMSAVARDAWKAAIRRRRREALLADANELAREGEFDVEHIDEIIRADRNRDWGVQGHTPTDE